MDEAKPLKEFNLEDAASFIILGIGVLIGLAGVSVFRGVPVRNHLSTCGIILAAFLWGIGGGTDSRCGEWGLFRLWPIWL
ncbi:MAG: hypothetical protein ACOX3D_09250 [Syntrophomonadales bacterium]